VLHGGDHGLNKTLTMLNWPYANDSNDTRHGYDLIITNRPNLAPVEREQDEG
jgi:hypothetical protein